MFAFDTMNRVLILDFVCCLFAYGILVSVVDVGWVGFGVCFDVGGGWCFCLLFDFVCFWCGLGVLFAVGWCCLIMFVFDLRFVCVI